MSQARLNSVHYNPMHNIFALHVPDQDIFCTKTNSQDLSHFSHSRWLNIEDEKNEVANCDDCIEIFLLHFLQFARKMSDPLHKAVSVDRLIGWEAFLELDP